MSLPLIILAALAMAMDAFAVSVSCSIGEDVRIKDYIKIPAVLGIFQGGMALIGYFAASAFSRQINQYSHWIAFGLLTIIGVKMIVEAYKNDPDTEESLENMSYLRLIVLGFATSIDALAAGISFSVLDIDIIYTTFVLTLVAVLLSIIGLKFGSKLGFKSETLADVIGGIVLIGIGSTILVQKLFF